jgi:hypothetical protein
MAVILTLILGITLITPTSLRNLFGLTVYVESYIAMAKEGKSGLSQTHSEVPFASEQTHYANITYEAIRFVPERKRRTSAKN